jgi:hypothetical protein
MNSFNLKTFVVLVLAFFFAVYLGIAAATAQLVAVGWITGVAGLVFVLALGRHVWALIPIGAMFAGTLAFLPGYPSVWYAMTPVATMMLLLRFLMRAKNFTYRFCWMDVAILLHVGALAQAYMRNPTGIALFGGSSIGGRPYIDYSVAIFAYFILATVKTDLKVVKKVIICMIVVALADQFLVAVTSFSGGLARAVGKVYSNVDYDAQFGGSGYSVDVGTARLTSLSGLGVLLSLLLFSFNRPLECFVPWRPKQFLSMMFTIAVIMLSGFRSNLIKLGCYFIAGTAIRRKPMDFVIAAAPAIVLVSLMLAVGPRSLPMAAQRTLSFLPIDVDPSIRESAEGSSDWRFEMWRLVLTSDRYIKNKLFGDGFGFSAAEHEAQVQNSMGVRKYTGDSIDAFIAKGSYHGWHVEAIRFTGVLGLIIGIIILFMFARNAWILVKHHKGTDFAPYSLFLCIPFLIEPFFTLFVFGSYKGSFITYIAMSAMLRLCYGLYLEDRSKVSQKQTENLEQEPQESQVLRGPVPGYGFRHASDRPTAIGKMGL